MAKSNPLISVIIPVYNAANYLNKCWRSLKSQSYNNIEFIFVDDCSSDNSYALLESYAENDKRVRLFKTDKNSGASAARNIGLNNVNGDWIGFCDSDDCCEPDMYESLVKCSVENNADIGLCGLDRIEENGMLIEKLWVSSENEKLNAREALHYWLIGSKIGNGMTTKLIKREIWGELRFPDGEIFEESYVIPQLFARCNLLVHTGKQSYKYITHKTSITNAAFDARRLVVFDREKYIKNFVEKYDNTLTKDVNCFIARQNISLYYSAIANIKDIKKEELEIIRKEFKRSFIAGLFNKNISFKQKMQLLELRSGIAYLRKLNIN